jgi:hypothetical protein
MASHCGLDDLGIESHWEQIFSTRPDWPWGQPSFLYNESRVIPGGKSTGAWHYPRIPL